MAVITRVKVHVNVTTFTIREILRVTSMDQEKRSEKKSPGVNFKTNCPS